MGIVLFEFKVRIFYQKINMEVHNKFINLHFDKRFDFDYLCFSYDKFQNVI